MSVGVWLFGVVWHKAIDNDVRLIVLGELPMLHLIGTIILSRSENRILRERLRQHGLDDKV